MSRVSNIVTGAGSGIGRATALALGRAGRMVIVSDVREDSANETAASIERFGGSATVVLADMLDDEDIANLVERADRIGPLTAIVHSAGLFPQQSFADSSVEDLERVMAVNFRAAFLLAKFGTAAMQGNGGSLVFLTSGAGLLNSAKDPFQQAFSIYGASKAALDRWALGISSELATLGIILSTIAPGAFVETAGTAHIERSMMPALASIDVDEVGRAVAWLALQPRRSLAGCRLNAVEFGKSWGFDDPCSTQ